MTTIGELKGFTQRIERLDGKLVESTGSGFLHENYDDGFTVTWNFENFASPQEVQERIETLAVWLWSLKDHLKGCLREAGQNPDIVETYVNSCRYLPICADIANGTKHGNLTRSRSGRFARISETVAEIRSGMSLRQTGDSVADVAMHVDKPESVTYRTRVRDNNDKYVGEGFVVLKNSWEEWQRLMKRYDALRPALP